MKISRALMAIALVVGLLTLAPTAAGAAPAVTGLSQTAGVNTGPTQLTITGSGFVPGSKVTFVEIDPAVGGDVEQTVATTGGTVSAEGTQISNVTIPTTGLPPTFTGEAPFYSGDVSWFVRVTNPDNSTDDSAEFNLIGEQPTLNTVTPSTVKQGDEAKTLTLDGSNFAQRAAISINNPGFPSESIIISEPSWKSLTRYTIKVSVPSDYPTGKRNITLKNTDGDTTTCTGCLEITAATPAKTPIVDEVSPSADTNADSKGAAPVTITGNNFNPQGSIEAALVGYCPNSQPSCPMNGRVIPVTITDVTVTPSNVISNPDDTIEGTVDLVLEAPGRYSVRVSNTGVASGSATLADSFQVTANAPSISSPTKNFPEAIKADETKSFSVTGSNFAKGVTVTIPGATVTQVELISRSRLTVTARGNSDAGDVRADLTVSNTNGNTAVCDDCVQLRAGITKTDKYINAVHQLFLGRAARTSEYTRWRSTVDSGNREALTRNLANSEEFAGVQIDLLYQEILGRSSDSGGRAYWLDQVRRGLRLDEIASFFYGGPEYFQRNGSTNRKYVEALYRDILGRPADAEGRDFWVSQIEGGDTRSAVAAGFYASIESRRGRVVQQYRLVLNRNPDAAGREYWAEQIRTLGDIVLASFLAASDEYYNRVTRVS